MSENDWEYIWTNPSDLGPKIESVPVAQLFGAGHPNSFRFKDQIFHYLLEERSPGIYTMLVPKSELALYDALDEDWIKIISSIYSHSLSGGSKKTMTPEGMAAYRYILYLWLHRTSTYTPRLQLFPQKKKRRLCREFVDLSYYSVADFSGFDDTHFWGGLRDGDPILHHRYRSIFAQAVREGKTPKLNR